MLIHTMSLDEMRSAIKKDLPWIERYKLRIKTALMRQKRKNKTQIGNYVEWKKHPQSFTQWVFSGHYHSISYEVNAYCHYRAPEGNFLIRFFPEDDDILRFNPHFFERYKERLELKQNEYAKLVEHYIRRNIDNHVIPQSESNKAFKELGGDYQIFGVIIEGVGLGVHYQKQKLYEFKTFVSNALMFKKQTNMRHMVMSGLMNLHDKYCDEFKSREAFKVYYLTRKLLQTEKKLLIAKEKEEKLIKEMSKQQENELS